jgi:hypothetical protein
VSQTNDETMVVLVAGYSGVAAAVAAFDAVSGVYKEHYTDGAAYCDAAVIDPHETDLGSRVVRETAPSGQPQARDLHPRPEGLARRMASYLFEGLALTGGPAGGGGQDIHAEATTGEATGPLDPDDLMRLGAVQETASAVLIGVFPAVLNDGIAAATNAANKRVSKELRASAEQLEAQIVKAEQKSIADAPGVGSPAPASTSRAGQSSKDRPSSR